MTIRRRVPVTARVVLVPSMAAMVVAACAAAGGQTPTPAQSVAGANAVRLANFAFQPGTLSVAAGTRVMFINGDAAEHTVTEGSDGTAVAGGRFDQVLDEGKTIAVPFSAAGTYRITCRFHPTMNMTVTVTG